jgi:energy-coupling factor transport system permease protein
MKKFEINPIVKFFSLLILAIFVLFIIDIYPLFYFIVLIIIINLLSKVNIKNFLRFLLAALPILFSVFFFNSLFVSCGNPIGILTFTDVGINYGLIIALRFFVIILFTYYFVATTNPKDFVIALVQYLKIPDKFAYATFIALRFFPIVKLTQEEALEAYKQRGIRLANPKAWFPLFSLLVFTMFRKAISLAISMELRGFGVYKRKVYIRKLKTTIDDILFVLFIIVYITLGLYFMGLAGYFTGFFLFPPGIAC